MTVPWRVAKSLLVLRDQIKAAYPGTPNPGFIGDADHASRDSDHNPWVDDPASTLNVVTAGDWYNRPALGFSSYGFAEILRHGRDPRIKYVISIGRIFRSYGKTVDGKYYPAWSWAPYYGPNPHTGHTHVSVSSTKSLYDDTRKWVITLLGEDDADPAPPKEDEMTPAQMTEIKEEIQRWALWGALYELETEDDKAAARDAYESAIAAGKTQQEAMAAAASKLASLRAALKTAQAEL